MDYHIKHVKHNKIRLFKEFHYLDLIPYSIALLMVFGECYILMLFLRISHYIK